MPEMINPLRYPGAKRFLVNYVDDLLTANHLQGCCFFEPHAGSAAVGLELLQRGRIASLVLCERDILLYDGIATVTYDSVGNPLIERCITTYQTNALGILDPSYLDIETLATLAEIRYQFKARMISRFIIPRFKLADDGFPVTPGSYVVTPKTIRQEIIALFTLLRDVGLIENLDDFIDNLIVERDTSDVNRVNTLLPPDLINQFRVLAGIIQFIL